MSLSAPQMKQLLDAGLNAEQMVIVASLLDAKEAELRDFQKQQEEQREKKRAADRERKRNSAGIPAEVATESLEFQGSPPMVPQMVSPKNPFLNPSLPPSEDKSSVPSSARARNPNFEEFWRGYPHKVGKGQAHRAFGKAMDKTSLPAMLEAIRTYIANKPPDVAFCNPATWLNGERWLDEYPSETEKAQMPMSRQTNGASEPDTKARLDHVMRTRYASPN